MLENNIRGNSYSFNFKKFKELKKKVNFFLRDKYWDDIMLKFQDKEFKEAFYKYILWFSGQTDVFNSWRKKDILEFNLDSKIEKIIWDTKRHIKEILYQK